MKLGIWSFPWFRELKCQTFDRFSVNCTQLPININSGFLLITDVKVKAKEHEKDHISNKFLRGIFFDMEYATNGEKIRSSFILSSLNSRQQAMYEVKEETLGENKEPVLFLIVTWIHFVAVNSKENRIYLISYHIIIIIIIVESLALWQLAMLLWFLSLSSIQLNLAHICYEVRYLV